MKISKLFIVFFVVIFLSGCMLKSNTELDCGITNEIINNDLPYVPSEYKETIEDYKKIVEYRLSKTFENEYNNGKNPVLNDNLQTDLTAEIADPNKDELSLQYKWHCMLVKMPSNINNLSMDAFSYVLKDINKDGISELIWISSDYQTVFCIFTILEGRAKLVDAYWPKYKAVIHDSGEIVIRSSGGVDVVEYIIYEIDNNIGDSRRLVRIFGEDRGEYYEMVNGESRSISEEQYNNLLLMYPYSFGETWNENPSQALSF